MIRYALCCDEDHEFEAWFPGSDAYDLQAAKGLVECPVCGTTKVAKQIMAPAVSSSTRRKGVNEPAAPAAPPPAPPDGSSAKTFHEFAAKVRAHIRATHVYVGEKFAEEARAMHEGEKNEAAIYGEATPTEAASLREDGVPVAPLPPPFAPVPPKKAN
jgi:hypothetical protein